MLRAETNTVVERIHPEPWRGGSYVPSSTGRSEDDPAYGNAASPSSLISVIKDLKEAIRCDGATIRTNETRTRNALIDPILRAMTLDSPSVMTPEYLVKFDSGGFGVADNALHAPGDVAHPVAFIEAKRMGKWLTKDHRDQVFKYAFARAGSIRCVALTNGDRWEFYQILEARSRRICSLSIRRDAADFCAKTLIRGFRMMSPEGGSQGQGSPRLPKLGVQDVISAAPSPEILPPATAGMPFSVDLGKILTWFGVFLVAGMMVGYVVGFWTAGPQGGAFASIGLVVAMMAMIGVGVLARSVIGVVLRGIQGAMRLERSPRHAYGDGRMPPGWLVVAIAAGAFGGGALGYFLGLGTAQPVMDLFAVLGKIVVFGSISAAAILVFVALAKQNAQRKRRK